MHLLNNNDHVPPPKLKLLPISSSHLLYFSIIPAPPHKIINTYYASIILNANSPTKCKYYSKITPAQLGCDYIITTKM